MDSFDNTSGEYVCKFINDEGSASRRVYHASDLASAMGQHNAAMPERRNKVISWLAPSGITFQFHDSKMTL